MQDIRQELVELVRRDLLAAEAELKKEGDAMTAEKKVFTRLPERIFSRIHQDIGQASMCWEHPEKAGLFLDGMAGRIAHDLCVFTADELDKEAQTPRPLGEYVRCPNCERRFNRSYGFKVGRPCPECGYASLVQHDSV